MSGNISGFGLFQFGVSPFGGPGPFPGPSGTYNEGVTTPPISELVLDAYERCGKESIELTIKYVQSARRSLNLILSSWTNNGPNLWKMQEVIQFIPQGVISFLDDASCVDILPDSVFVRQYLMGAATSETPLFSTQNGSNIITVGNLPAAAMAGGYISIVVPVSVGGLTLQGFYQVSSVPSATSATLLTVGNASATVVNGGVVPQFQTTANSPNITVTLPNHPYVNGGNFVVQVSTTVGGLVLFGPYVVSNVTTNTFVITSGSPAGSGQTVSENGGLAMLSVQATVAGLNQAVPPADIMMYPLSRGDYAAIPEKTIPGRPTSFWINKQKVPEIRIWPLANADGPYELHYWRHRQIQDADIVTGQVLDVPFRFQEAFTAALAAHLAMKWAKDRAADLAKYAASEYVKAIDNDRERVSTFIVPDMSGYFG